MSRRHHPHRRGRGLEQRQARRDELLDAAVAALRRHGAGASMDQLAGEGGVTKPILYRHFGDRDGLVQAVADRFARELMESLRAGLRASTEPRDLLHATIDAYLAFVERDPDVYRFLVRQAFATRSSDELGGFVGEIAREITVVIGEQLHQAGADTGGAEAWAHGMVGMVHMAGDWWLDRRTMPRSRLVAYLVDLLWDGLGSLRTQPEDET